MEAGGDEEVTASTYAQKVVFTLVTKVDQSLDQGNRGVWCSHRGSKGEMVRRPIYLLLEELYKLLLVVVHSGGPPARAAS
jgi:hypothetical protein